VRIHHLTCLIHFFHGLLPIHKAVVLGSNSHSGQVIATHWYHASLLWTIIATVM
jgi:hypothetical protein